VRLGADGVDASVGTASLGHFLERGVRASLGLREADGLGLALGLGEPQPLGIPLDELRRAPQVEIPLRPARRRVLVVDDNEDGADSLAAILQWSGHETATSYNGLDAIEKVSTFRPEIVFLDIGLPGIDGYEVARRLRADDRTTRTMFVALTGWGSEEDKQKSMDAGFHYHLTKPVLADAVADLLSKFPLV
jgi:CheY-like chemotaxis protein